MFKSLHNASYTTKHLKKELSILFYIVCAVSIAGHVSDIFTLWNKVDNIVFQNLPVSIVLFVVFVLYYVKVIRISIAFPLVLYTVIGSITLSFLFYSSTSESISEIFLRDSLYIILALACATLFINKIHTFIITGIYLSTFFPYLLVHKPEFIENYGLFIFLVFIGFASLVYYFSTVLEKVLKKLNDDNKVIEHKSNELEWVNNLLKQEATKIDNQNKHIASKNALLLRKEAELMELNASKDKFLSIMAHDIKNPLNTMMGYVQLSVNRFANISEEKKIHFLKNIQTSGNNLVALIEELLIWSTAQQQSAKPKTTATNLNETVSDVVQNIKPNLLAKSVMVAIDIEPNTIVNADTTMLKTILRNLLTNAIKFSHVGGKIQILYKEKSSPQIHIIDNGVGMDEEQLNKLFSLEHSSTTTGTNGERGTGLGLLICKDLVEKHKGIISVSSKKDVGSDFWFTIPKETKVLRKEKNESIQQI